MISAVVVADSSPLISLAIIEQLTLLPQLYRRILVPPAVWHEVTVQGVDLPGAQAVRQSSWLEIEIPQALILEPLSILVDRGEAEAIALAQSIPDSTVLLDDAQARRVAERLGICRIGTLGILRRAKKAGLIAEVKVYVEQLRTNGIYIKPNLVDAVLKDVGEMD
jgi:predicted nucleic acid-binding protein